MSNPPLGNFAAAAASAKSGGNAKISSAELLSMLKKPGNNPSVGSNSNNSTSNSATASPTAPPPTTTAAAAVASPANITVAASVEKPINAVKDDYSLLSLVNLIKSCPADRNIFSIGVDLERTGLAFNQSEPLRENFNSPWFDGGFETTPPQSIVDAPSSLLGMNRVAGGSTSGRASPHPQNTPSLLLQGRRPSTLDSIIPPCYLVPSIPPPATKIGSFADETLFYIFYSMPGDRMQDSAARELNVRGWRFHKPSKSWVKEDKDGAYFMFDQTAWIKVRRQLTVQPTDLEESRAPSSGAASTGSANAERMVMHGSGTLQNQSVTH